MNSRNNLCVSKDEETLDQMIVLAHELLYGTAPWLRTARFPEEARNKFREAIENALMEHALQDGKLDQAAARLREAGGAFLKKRVYRISGLTRSGTCLNFPFIGGN